MTDGYVAWLVPGDKTEQLLPVGNSRWILMRYTTRSLSERLEGFVYYEGPGSPYEDTSPAFSVVIPDYRPKRFSLTLPAVDVDGRKWAAPSN